MTGDLDDGTACRAFERALHESTVIADRIREAIADAPPKLVMLALSDLLQEHLTRLVVELDLQVLVAEDEFLVRRMVADVLREQGFHVFEAGDAEEAVGILKAVPVDAVVTDLRM